MRDRRAVDFRATMILDETDDRFYIAASAIPGAGQGLFARSALASGDGFEVIGTLVRSGSLADQCTHYADHHKVRAADGLLLVPMGFGSLVNHSRTPNLEKVLEGERVFFRALRPIAAGEELCFTYSDAGLERLGLPPE
jgi:hypothetical protein